MDCFVYFELVGREGRREQSSVNYGYTNINQKVISSIIIWIVQVNVFVISRISRVRSLLINCRGPGKQANKSTVPSNSFLSRQKSGFSGSLRAFLSIL
jgi:hypothetical protein